MGNPSLEDLNIARVPYFSQWESRDLNLALATEDLKAAVAQDPKWAESGALNREEYLTWVLHICGMACLKMILAARTGRQWPILELTRACTRYGGYQVEGSNGEIKGLIYAPFIEFVQKEFALRAEVVTGVTTAQLPGLFKRAEFFMASVHPWIRWPNREPPRKGGHLVLMIGCSEGGVVFHNPSGYERRTQESATLSLEHFDRFFAGRGVAIFR